MFWCNTIFEILNKLNKIIILCILCNIVYAFMRYCVEFSWKRFGILNYTTRLLSIVKYIKFELKIQHLIRYIKNVYIFFSGGCSNDLFDQQILLNSPVLRRRFCNVRLIDHGHNDGSRPLFWFFGFLTTESFWQTLVNDHDRIIFGRFRWRWTFKCALDHSILFFAGHHKTVGFSAKSDWICFWIFIYN